MDVKPLGRIKRAGLPAREQELMLSPKSVVRIGDWVNSYSSGIWQVYRVLEGFNELRYSLDACKKRSKRALVFSKRLVDGNWRPAFRAECCERSMVAPITPDERRQVEELFETVPGVKAAFEAYAPEPISLIVNLTMSVPDAARVSLFCKATLASEIAGGIPLDRVLLLLQQGGLAQYIGKVPINATLQLVCPDHEVRDGEPARRRPHQSATTHPAKYPSWQLTNSPLSFVPRRTSQCPALELRRINQCSFREQAADPSARPPG